MSPLDLSTVATQRVPTTLPVWTTDTRGSSSWFEPGGVEATIAGDVSVAARGLNVEQHSERVLMHLLGERDLTA
jgi:hypothetical protein